MLQIPTKAEQNGRYAKPTYDTFVEVEYFTCQDRYGKKKICPILNENSL